MLVSKYLCSYVQKFATLAKPVRAGLVAGVCEGVVFGGIVRESVTNQYRYRKRDKQDINDSFSGVVCELFV